MAWQSTKKYLEISPPASRGFIWRLGKIIYPLFTPCPHRGRDKFGYWTLLTTCTIKENCIQEKCSSRTSRRPPLVPSVSPLFKNARFERNLNFNVRRLQTSVIAKQLCGYENFVLKRYMRTFGQLMNVFAFDWFGKTPSARNFTFKSYPNPHASR